MVAKTISRAWLVQATEELLHDKRDRKNDQDNICSYNEAVPFAKLIQWVFVGPSSELWV